MYSIQKLFIILLKIYLCPLYSSLSAFLLASAVSIVKNRNEDECTSAYYQNNNSEKPKLEDLIKLLLKQHYSPIVYHFS